MDTMWILMVINWHQAVVLTSDNSITSSPAWAGTILSNV